MLSCGLGSLGSTNVVIAAVSLLYRSPSIEVSRLESQRDTQQPRADLFPKRELTNVAKNRDTAV